MSDTTIRVHQNTYKLVVKCRGALEHESGIRRTIDDTIANIAVYFLKNAEKASG